MIEQFLPSIKDPADYIRALTVFRATAPMTKEEVDSLLELYGKYLPEVDDPAYIRLCLAVDMLPGRDREDAEMFAPLGLAKGELEALWTVKDLVTCKIDMTEEVTQEVVVTTQNENVGLPARVILAREALDRLATSKDYAERREQIAALAEFLSSQGESTLDQYTVLLGEVRLKCRS